MVKYELLTHKDLVEKALREIKASDYGTKAMCSEETMWLAKLALEKILDDKPETEPDSNKKTEAESAMKDVVNGIQDVALKDTKIQVEALEVPKDGYIVVRYPVGEYDNSTILTLCEALQSLCPGANIVPFPDIMSLQGMTVGDVAKELIANVKAMDDFSELELLKLIFE